MPYFAITTNQTISAADRDELAKKASAFIAQLLAKPEAYVMVSVSPDLAMTFGGSTDPSAYVRLKSIGLHQSRCDEFAEKISDFLEQHARIPRNRVFIDFTELRPTLFAWDGKTF